MPEDKKQQRQIPKIKVLEEHDIDLSNLAILEEVDLDLSFLQDSTDKKPEIPDKEKQDSDSFIANILGIGASIPSGFLDGLENYARVARLISGSPEPLNFVRSIKQGIGLDKEIPGSESTKFIQEGVRSTLNSVTTGLPGFIFGSIGGPFGMTAGLAANASAIIGIAEYDRFMEDLEDFLVKNNVPQEEIQKIKEAAKDEAIISAVSEFGTELVSDLVSFGVAKILKTPGVSDLSKKAIGEFLRNFSRSYPVEAGTELINLAVQSEQGKDVAEEIKKVRPELEMPTSSFAENWANTLAVTAVQSVLYGGYGTARQRRFTQKEAKRLEKVVRDNKEIIDKLAVGEEVEIPKEKEKEIMYAHKFLREAKVPQARNLDKQLNEYYKRRITENIKELVDIKNKMSDPNITKQPEDKIQEILNRAAYLDIETKDYIAAIQNEDLPFLRDAMEQLKTLPKIKITDEGIEYNIQQEQTKKKREEEFKKAAEAEVKSKQQELLSEAELSKIGLPPEIEEEIRQQLRDISQESVNTIDQIAKEEISKTLKEETELPIEKEARLEDVAQEEQQPEQQIQEQTEQQPELKAKIVKKGELGKSLDEVAKLEAEQTLKEEVKIQDKPVQPEQLKNVPESSKSQKPISDDIPKGENVDSGKAKSQIQKESKPKLDDLVESRELSKKSLSQKRTLPERPNVKPGAVVKYKGNTYLVRKTNKSGNVQLIKPDGTLFSGTPKPDKLEPLYNLPVIKYNKAEYIVTNKDEVYSVNSGKKIVSEDIRKNVLAEADKLISDKSVSIKQDAEKIEKQEQKQETKKELPKQEQEQKQVETKQEKTEEVSRKQTIRFTIDKLKQLFNKKEYPEIEVKLPNGKVIKLNEQQREAVALIKSFINDVPFDRSNIKNNVFALMGYAGTGKTTSIQEVLKGTNKPIQFAAPTHKAKSVLKDVLGVSGGVGHDVETIHSLLGFGVEDDITKFDPNNPNFKPKRDDNVVTDGILIIDEASMINEKLYDYLLEIAKIRNTKIIFMGDPAQINPVNEKISKVFSETQNIYELTKVERQSDTNPVSIILEGIRDNIKSEKVNFEHSDNVNNKTGEGIIFRKGKEIAAFIRENIDNFKDPQKRKNIKILAWTNEKVGEYNRFIRSVLFPNSSDLVVKGDFLVGQTGIEGSIKNSFEYTVKNSRYYPFGQGEEGYAGWQVTLFEEETKKEIYTFIIDHRDKRTIDKINKDYQAILARVKAAGGRGKAWFPYYRWFNSWLTLERIPFGNRQLSPKISYGYAMTVHKAQGSTYDTVIVDEDNIMLNKKTEERNRLLYTAFSRARKLVVSRYEAHENGKIKQETVAKSVEKIKEEKKEQILEAKIVPKGSVKTVTEQELAEMANAAVLDEVEASAGLSAANLNENVFENEADVTGESLEEENTQPEEKQVANEELEKFEENNLDETEVSNEESEDSIEKIRESGKDINSVTKLINFAEEILGIELTHEQILSDAKSMTLKEFKKEYSYIQEKAKSYKLKGFSLEQIYYKAKNSYKRENRVGFVFENGKPILISHEELKNFPDTPSEIQQFSVLDQLMSQNGFEYFWSAGNYVPVKDNKGQITGITKISDYNLFRQGSNPVVERAREMWRNGEYVLVFRTAQGNSEVWVKNTMPLTEKEKKDQVKVFEAMQKTIKDVYTAVGMMKNGKIITDANALKRSQILLNTGISPEIEKQIGRKTKAIVVQEDNYFVYDKGSKKTYRFTNKKHAEAFAKKINSRVLHAHDGAAYTTKEFLEKILKGVGVEYVKDEHGGVKVFIWKKTDKGTLAFKGFIFVAEPGTPEYNKLKSSDTDILIYEDASKLGFPLNTNIDLDDLDIKFKRTTMKLKPDQTFTRSQLVISPNWLQRTYENFLSDLILKFETFNLRLFKSKNGLSKFFSEIVGFDKSVSQMDMKKLALAGANLHPAMLGIKGQDSPLRRIYVSFVRNKVMRMPRPGFHADFKPNVELNDTEIRISEKAFNNLKKHGFKIGDKLMITRSPLVRGDSVMILTVVGTHKGGNVIEVSPGNYAIFSTGDFDGDEGAAIIPSKAEIKYFEAVRGLIGDVDLSKYDKYIDKADKQESVLNLYDFQNMIVRNSAGKDLIGAVTNMSSLYHTLVMNRKGIMYDTKANEFSFVDLDENGKPTVSINQKNTIVIIPKNADGDNFVFTQKIIADYHLAATDQAKEDKLFQLAKIRTGTEINKVSKKEHAPVTSLAMEIFDIVEEGRLVDEFPQKRMLIRKFLTHDNSPFISIQKPMQIFNDDPLNGGQWSYDDMMNTIEEYIDYAQKNNLGNTQLERLIMNIYDTAFNFNMANVPGSLEQKAMVDAHVKAVKNLKNKYESGLSEKELSKAKSVGIEAVNFWNKNKGLTYREALDAAVKHIKESGLSDKQRKYLSFWVLETAKGNVALTSNKAYNTAYNNLANLKASLIDINTMKDYISEYNRELEKIRKDFQSFSEEERTGMNRVKLDSTKVYKPCN
jgi:exodeoxyribonuclease-5